MLLSRQLNNLRSCSKMEVEMDFKDLQDVLLSIFKQLLIYNSKNLFIS